MVDNSEQSNRIAEIEWAIHKADIPLGSAVEGDCGAIARAIHSVFGGQYAVFSDDDGNPRHAAVVIDGDLYDGTGKTGIETLFLFFTDREDVVDTFESVEECPNIELTEKLSGFVVQKDLTAEIIARLES